MKRKMLRVIFVICVLNLSALVAAQDGAILERGAYLAEAIVACGNCHTPKDPDTGVELDGMAYAGGFLIETPGFYANASNITMDIETGIGSWTDEEIIVAIRDGLRPDGDLSPDINTMTRMRFPINLVFRRSQHEAKKIYRRTNHRIYQTA
ncbi:MAG: cytochrome c [Proteobacteria bacterium]|nr:cytochrome c [Pseudomonadota bacterium]